MQLRYLASFELAWSTPTRRTPHGIRLRLRNRRYVTLFPLLSLLFELLFVLGGLFLTVRRLFVLEIGPTGLVTALRSACLPLFELNFGLCTLPTVEISVTDGTFLGSIVELLSFFLQTLVRTLPSATDLHFKHCAALVPRPAELFTALRAGFLLFCSLYRVVVGLCLVQKRVSTRTFKVTMEA